MNDCCVLDLGLELFKLSQDLLHLFVKDQCLPQLLPALSSDSMSSFETFKQQFHGDIITSEHPEYEQAISQWSACSVKRARIVAFQNDKDIATAIK